MLTYSKAFVTRVACMGRGWTQRCLPSVWRRSTDEGGPHEWTLISPTVISAVSVLPQAGELPRSPRAMGEWKAYFFKYTQNFVITSRKDLAPFFLYHHCFQELISNLIQLLLGNCVLMLLCLVSGQRLLSVYVCVCGMTLACVGTVYIAGSRDPICYEGFKA